MMTRRPNWCCLRRAVLLASVVLALMSGEPAWAVITFTTDTLIDDGDPTYDGEEIVVNGCTVTINGAHNFATLLITNAGVLTHTAGQSGFDLTITGDLTVDVGGSISADGKGFGSSSGPGQGGDGYGSGARAGYGGAGGNSYDATGGIAYGSITKPLELGSGGGVMNFYHIPGGSGGGAIRLTVDGTLLIDGNVSANGAAGLPGGSNGSGGGSGGSIYITADIVAGTGLISANGGMRGPSGGSGGARVDASRSTTARTALQER